MIKWPFAPIGMLIDNALSQKANKVLIDLKTLEIKQDNLEYLLLGKTQKFSNMVDENHKTEVLQSYYFEVQDNGEPYLL